MLIGAHESTAGGLHTAFARGEADGCRALQIFTGYNTRWAPRPINDLEGSLFFSEAARCQLPVISHCCYLINLASPHPPLWRRSVRALVEELERCETLGITGTVLHPGAHMGQGEAAGLRRVARALGQVHQLTRGFACRVLLENTAGQGSTLGHRFGQLAWLLDNTPDGDRLGVCIDTCHAFAAGYPLDSQPGYASTIDRLACSVGLERIHAFHLNDAQRTRGSRVDRHAHIGEGQLGLGAFTQLVNDPRLARLPGLVETPPEPDGSPSFARNIRALAALIRR